MTDPFDYVFGPATAAHQDRTCGCGPDCQCGDACACGPQGKCDPACTCAQ